MDITSFVLGYQKGKASGGGSGGGGSADVRYVTFMSHDGTKEYGKKAVAVGDDCADPIARGIFATPTRESTAQYDYTFIGWATTPNGAWDENALKTVTVDRTVYAAYASAVRYYTITYLDSDGVTVLKTESVAYGSIPSYNPTKDDFNFAGWTPALAVVTGNASYVASWEEKPLFESMTWAEISEICETGNAASVFAVGDTHPVTLTYADGTTQTGTLEIIGFNHDNLADGSGKAGITLEFTGVMTGYGKSVFNSNSNDTSATFAKGALKPLYESTFVAFLPADLQSVLKTVTKKHVNGYFTGTSDYNCKLFPLSVHEMGGNFTTNFSSVKEGEVYQKYAENTEKAVDTAYTILRKGGYDYWTRTRASGINAYRVSSANKFVSTQRQNSYYCTFACCI